MYGERILECTLGCDCDSSVIKPFVFVIFFFFNSRTHINKLEFVLMGGSATALAFLHVVWVCSVSLLNSDTVFHEEPVCTWPHSAISKQRLLGRFVCEQALRVENCGDVLWVSVLQTSGAASEQFGFDDSRNIFILFNLFPFRISLFAVTVALQSLYAWSFVIKAYHYYCYKILSFFSFPSSYCCCPPIS